MADRYITDEQLQRLYLADDKETVHQIIAEVYVENEEVEQTQSSSNTGGIGDIFGDAMEVEMVVEDEWVADVDAFTLETEIDRERGFSVPDDTEFEGESRLNPFGGVSAGFDLGPKGAEEIVAELEQEPLSIEDAQTFISQRNDFGGWSVIQTAVENELYVGGDQIVEDIELPYGWTTRQTPTGGVYFDKDWEFIREENGVEDQQAAMEWIEANNDNENGAVIVSNEDHHEELYVSTSHSADYFDTPAGWEAVEDEPSVGFRRK